jgi:hypothetical protein
MWVTRFNQEGRMRYVPGKVATGRRNQRDARGGVTLVLVAISVTVLFMFGGFGMDFARMYAFKAQLKTLTDAAAIAAATEIKLFGTEANATARAVALKDGNRVNGSVIAVLGDTNITYGTWNFATDSFTSPVSYSAANAVRVRARYTASWTLAKVFGSQTRTLVSESVAAIGSLGTSQCMKPWAVPYSNMLATLNRADGGSRDSSYRLTNADVNRLRTRRDTITFKIGSGGNGNGNGGTNGGTGSFGSTVIPGNYYAVKLGPVRYANGTTPTVPPEPGASAYSDAIGSNTCQNTGTASVGDWLDLQNGNMVGPTNSGLNSLCGNNNTSSCNKTIVVPIWNTQTAQNGSAWVQILYIGTFQLTGTTGNGANTSIVGYLTALSTSPGSGFIPRPGPIGAVALVQ